MTIGRGSEMLHISNCWSNQIHASIKSYSQRFEIRKLVFEWPDVDESWRFWTGDKSDVWWRKEKDYLWDSQLYRSWGSEFKIRSLLWGWCVEYWCNFVYFACRMTSFWNLKCEVNLQEDQNELIFLPWSCQDKSCREGFDHLVA